MSGKSESGSGTWGRLARRAAAAAGRIAAIVVILSVGAVGAIGLSRLQEPPAPARPEERALPVEVLRVAPEDVPVTITGFGEVRVRERVSVIPEVAGTVVEVNPRLNVGDVIPKGGLLFRVDPRNYAVAHERAQAGVEQAESTLARLEQQQALDRERLQTLDRSLSLSREQFERVRTLFEEDEVGTRAGVEQAELAYNQTREGRDQLRRMVELYPAQLREARSGVAAARAELRLAEVNLERTEVRAPINARILRKMVETGQYVAPGAAVLEIADDSVLEMSVPLDTRDVRQWLRFTGQGPEAGVAWFNQPEPVVCEVFWTEDPEGHVWQGRLVRVEQFSPQSRTVTVAIEIDGAHARSEDGGRLPLVDGMFCGVRIPGQVMREVFRVPRWAITFEGDTFVVEDNRLRVRRVDVLRTEGEESFVSAGLDSGDIVIVTRLVNPLPNTLVEVSMMAAPEDLL